MYLLFCISCKLIVATIKVPTLVSTLILMEEVPSLTAVALSAVFFLEPLRTLSEGCLRLT